MEVVKKQPTYKGVPERFIGDVWIDMLATGRGPAPMRVNTVRFAPVARNAWHADALGQTLHVIEGRGLVQARGETAVEVHAGDTIYAPPGEWHWHGATPDQRPDGGSLAD